MRDIAGYVDGRARKFAADIRVLSSKMDSNTPLLFHVYGYPTHDQGDEEDPRFRGSSRQDMAPRRRGSERRFPRPAASTKGLDPAEDPAATATLPDRPGAWDDDDARAPCASARSEVRPLETLLVRPLPTWKRMLDISGATLGIAISWPIMLAAIVLIRVESPGPAIFRQRRSGLGGKPFDIFKFRTMVADAEQRKSQLMGLNEQDGPAFKIRHDPRITAIGKILRKTSLDELPQLFNVLRGEMSLVGPRPLPVKEQTACDQWHRRRLDVTPGLTCIWQVKGRSTVSFDRWVGMDVSYIQRRTFMHDMKLLAQTVPAVVLRKGAR